MSVPECHRPASLTQLIDVMVRFANDNKHDNNNLLRWSAWMILNTVPVLQQVHSNSLSEETMERVQAFLLSEIEQKLAAKRTELEALERDAQRLRDRVNA